MSDITELAYAFGKPTAHGKIRVSVEDFQVDEVLGFDLKGEGEHVCLHIRKRGLNTADVAQQIQKLAGVKQMDVSYAGLKDRHAVTTQWFSVYLASKSEPDWQQLITDSIEILEIKRHNRKLRRGSLKGNLFTLIVRDLESDPGELEQRLEKIAVEGVPNYFGEQRFGHNNLERATAMFEGKIKVRDRNKRSMYLSATRSAIFNQVLSKRVSDDSWNQALTGDQMMLAGSHSVFLVESVDEEIRHRLKIQDIHPTAPMWGRGRLATTANAMVLEEMATADLEIWRYGLEHAGLKQERRALRLPVQQFEWQIKSDVLSLHFFLDSGSYATTVLREIINT